MKYAIERNDNFIIFEPLSEVLEGDDAIQLKVEFLLRNNTGQKNIILDLQNVRKIDESGVRVGVLAHRLCSSVGGLFILTGVSSEIYDFLKMCRVEKTFILLNSVEEGKKYILKKQNKNHE